VRGACDLLGLEPIGMANEGRFLLMVPESQAVDALALLRRHQPLHLADPLGRGLVAAEGGAGAPRERPGRQAFTGSRPRRAVATDLLSQQIC
jgi:hypothetical protein